MGRIDEALRRSNMDASAGTGAQTPAALPVPWAVERDDDAGAAGPEASLTRGSMAEGPALRPAPRGDGQPAHWSGFDPAVAERLVVSEHAKPLLVEQFRTLAAGVLRAQVERSLKSVVVTSASPGDGKSYVSVNLALTLSESYHRRVLLIDADLRRPTLHQMFGIRHAKGLGEALSAGEDERPATVRISETLTLLPAGQLESNPLGGLSSERMKRIIADAVSRFDWVITDSPPVGVLADASLVSESVDAAILVVRAGVTRLSDLEAAVDTVGHDRILGVVLNAVDPTEIRGGVYYSHYYGREGEKG
jgi:capsular exopolysaccharide synthesis family protein